MSEGPYPYFTLVLCACQETGVAAVSAFPDAATAVEHAKWRLLSESEWTTVLVARCVGSDLQFIGAWDLDAYGGLTWEAANQA